MKIARIPAHLSFISLTQRLLGLRFASAVTRTFQPSSFHSPRPVNPFSPYKRPVRSHIARTYHTQPFAYPELPVVVAMARKLPELTPDSSLSPPPSDLDMSAAIEEKADSTITAVNGKKRKAEATVRTTKRARKVAIKDETSDEVGGSLAAEDADPTPKKRGRRVTKVEQVVESEVKVTEGEDGIKVTAKKTRQRKKKETNEQPLEERTVGSKLRVGAHVSIAGG